MPATSRALIDLARTLVRASSADEPDVQSVDKLSELSGLTRRVFQNRCQVANVTARECVHFVQCLRAVRTVDADWTPEALMPFCDPRTLKKLIAQGRLSRVTRPAVGEFVKTQQFIINHLLVEALLAELGQHER